MSHRPTTPRSHLLRAVVLLLIGALGLGGCSSVVDLPLPGGAKTGKNPMTVQVKFRDVLDLVPQSSVKVDDVTVGKVTRIKLNPGALREGAYVADVTVELPRDVGLPKNAQARIRQTSLLGEKFVELSAPKLPQGKLGNNDVIGLNNTGRNPEVEEVLNALALLLNGGGVGQLKTIAAELNQTLGGRESEVRSVLRQIRSFMAQLDANKQALVDAIENTNRLAVQLRRSDPAIKAALDDLPAALKSVNSQRRDLVRALRALERLSGLGVRVIRAAKESTINSLRDLGPVLEAFASAGQDLPKVSEVILTYPFPNAVAGRNPQAAHALKPGDYTNLSMRLDLDLFNLPQLPELPGLPEPVCKALDQIGAQTRANVTKAVNQVIDALPATPLITKAEKERLRQTLTDKILAKALAQAKKQCRAVNVSDLVNTVTSLLPDLLDVLNILTPSQIRGLLNGGLGQLGGVLDGLGSALPRGPKLGGGNGDGLLGLGRPAPGSSASRDRLDPYGLNQRGMDPGIGTMLLQPLEVRR